MFKTGVGAEQIYLSLIKIVCISNIVNMFLITFLEQNFLYFVLPVVTFLIMGVSFTFYKKNKVQIAYHILISGFLIFFAVTFPYLGNYRSMILAFPFGTICSNLMFENRKVNIIYTILSIACGIVFLLIVFNHTAGLDSKLLILEIFYLVTFLITTYVMSNIYLSNLLIYKKTVAAREQAIQQSNEELQKYIASNLELENFAYLASHDLRSPLQNVISFSKLLNRKLKPKMTTQEQQFFRYITEGSERMQETIEALLRFSLVNNNDIIVEKSNVIQIIDDIQNDLHRFIVDNKATIVVNNMPDEVFVDAKLFRELFLNLISNAIKFAKKDENPKIEISCKATERQYVFSVSDNGIGIEAESQNIIFGIFKRLHLQEEYEGTGIGLALCSKIVEKHNGKIWVESELGKGSTFYFTIIKKLDEKI
ncbi:MAG: sensor histidine kinase [Chitinophagales bacterium]